MRYPSLAFACRLCLVVLLAPAGWTMDLRPYAGKDAVLMRDDIARRQKLWQSVSVDAYKAHGTKDPRFDADMVRLLEATAAVTAGGPLLMPTSEAVALAKRLTGKDGSPDPLAKWALFTLLRGGDWKAVNKACDQARNALSDDKPLADGNHRYSPLLLAYPHAHCLDSWGRPDKPEKMKTAVVIANELAAVLTEVIKSHVCDSAPSSLVRLARNINLNHQDLGEPVVKAVDAALDAAHTDPWLANTVKAAIRIKNAWAWRGSGWADSVTEDGWKGFSRNLKEADGFLGEAYRLNAREPLVGCLGITLANAGESSAEPKEWFRRSIAACFDFTDSYQTARNFQLPRWGGSYFAILSLGCDGVDTGRFDTDVPENLLDCITTVIGDAHQMNALPDMKDALSTPRVATSCDALIAAMTTRAPGRATEYAWTKIGYLWHAGRIDEAKTVASSLPEGSLSSDIAKLYHINAAMITGKQPAGSATKAAPATENF